MGWGTYSSSTRNLRSTTLGYDTKPIEEIFERRSLTNQMNPYDVALRESRDSEEHPNSVAIILGLDVTGSMGTIPHYLVKEGLPKIVTKIIEAGIKDPQLLFMGIGDHLYDSAPLQIGQFESSDELLDKWLTDLYLEGGGGGNGGESYSLAWHFASTRTATDCFEKRNQKGYLFTIGDEPCHRKLQVSRLNQILGKGDETDYTSAQVLAMAQEKYNVYHIHLAHGPMSSDPAVISGWREILGDNLIVCKSKEDVSRLIPEKIISTFTVDTPLFSTSEEIGSKVDDLISKYE